MIETLRSKQQITGELWGSDFHLCAMDDSTAKRPLTTKDTTQSNEELSPLCPGACPERSEGCPSCLMVFAVDSWIHYN